jgi:hypothetical protein
MDIIYKIDYPNADKPIRQEVEKAGFPNLDAEGETQYENTHFSDEATAWDALVRELDAGLRMDTKIVKQIIEDLQKAKDSLTETALLLERAKHGRENFLSNID